MVISDDATIVFAITSSYAMSHDATVCLITSLLCLTVVLTVTVTVTVTVTWFYESTVGQTITLWCYKYIIQKSIQKIFYEKLNLSVKLDNVRRIVPRRGTYFLLLYNTRVVDFRICDLLTYF